MINFKYFIFLIPFFFTNKTISSQNLNTSAFCFYYNWYGSVEKDGKNYHWSHPVMPQNNNDTVTKSFLGNGNIGADYYPLAGEYSSADTFTIARHMKEIASAGIGVIAVTWLGTDDASYKSVAIILDFANDNNLKVCFQIEPRVRVSAIATCNAVKFLINTFGNHPAFYRNLKTNKPIFFVYDSYLIDADEWAAVLKKDGSSNLLRNSKYDSEMIGLWCWKEDSTFFLKSGFDGFYTYFASRGFTFGANPDNWKYLQKFAIKHNLSFIPSVGPGYSDNRIRPWNIKNTKNRQEGFYYDSFFESALKAGVNYIGITSYNEWHEGTQIEPAKPMTYKNYHYKDYGKLPTNYYLNRTKYWLNKFN